MNKTLIEFFSGSCILSNYFKQNGYKTFTIDIERKYNPDLVIDIFYFNSSMLPNEFKKPEILWFSPPCNCFSIASVYRHWKNKKPVDDKTIQSIKLVKKCLELIKELKPKYYFIENPRGMLRTLDFMKKLPRKTITYCQYGQKYQKTTDIWTNCNYFIGKKCKSGDNCHEEVRRTGKGGIQSINGKNSAYERAKLPINLCKEIFLSINHKTKIYQSTFEKWQ